MSSTGSVRDGKGHRAYRRQRDRLEREARASGATCSRCGNPYDFDNPRSARGFTADHPEALANGGHLTRQTLVPMCRSCNARKGNHADTEIWGAT